MNATAPVDNRALLSSIGSRNVRTVAREISRFSDALFTIVRERKPRSEAWSMSEWMAVLEELDESEITVAAFLEAEHARVKSCP